MTPEQKEVITLAISDAELERRWNAVRTRKRSFRRGTAPPPVGHTGTWDHDSRT